MPISRLFRRLLSLLILVFALLLTLLVINPVRAERIFPSVLSTGTGSTTIYHQPAAETAPLLAQTPAISEPLIFTYTETFTSYAFYDSASQQVDWNIFAGQVQLAELSGTATQTCPDMAVDADDNTIVVWLDYRNGNHTSAPDPDIYAQKFDPDGHRLWPADIRVNSDRGNALQGCPKVVINNEDLPVVVWPDQRSEGAGVYGQKLNKQGQQVWIEDSRVNATLLDTSRFDISYIDIDAALDAGTGNVVVVWDARSPIYSDIYVRPLKVNGDPEWFADKRVNRYTRLYQYNPAIAVASDGTMYVAWEDKRANCDDCPTFNSDFYIERLDRLGFHDPNWSNDNNDVRITDTSIGVNSPYNLGISIDIILDASDNLLVVWSDIGNVYVQQLDTDNGAKLWTNDLVDNTDTVAAPVITINNEGNFFVAWHSGEYDFWSTPRYRYINIYLKKLDINADGVVFNEERTFVSRTANVTRQTDPAINIGRGDIRIAWIDNRSGTDDIYLQRFNNDNEHLWLTDLRGTDDVGPATLEPTITNNSNDAFITWADGRARADNINVYGHMVDTDSSIIEGNNVRLNNFNLEISETSFNWSTVAAGESGKIAAVWDDSEDVYARLISSDGVPIWSSELPVTADGDQIKQVRADVALGPNDNLFVVWDVYTHDSNKPTNIALQKIDSAGNKIALIDQISVHTPVTTTQSHPAITYDEASNSLFVVWQENRIASHDYDVFMQRLNLAGNPLWPEDVRVSSVSFDTRQSKLTVSAANGYAYVTWQAEPEGESQILTQRVYTDATKWPTDQVVATGDQPAIVAADNGDSYVVWRAWVNDGWDIFIQRLDSAGQLVGSAVKVTNELTGAVQTDPNLSIDENGNVYVVWEEYKRNQPDIDIQRFLPDLSRTFSWINSRRVTPVHLYYSGGKAQSAGIDNASESVVWAVMTPTVTLPPDTEITYFLTNKTNDWDEVTPGEIHRFSAPGSDLRWKIELWSNDTQTATPILHDLQIVYSVNPNPCTPQPENSVCVLDEAGQAVVSATVYLNQSALSQTTDESGIIQDNLITTGDKLIALQQVYEQPTNKAAHTVDDSGNFAFRVYRTSMPLTLQSSQLEYPLGTMAPTVAQNNHPVLYIDPDNTLVLFNIVASLEWDASGEDEDVEQLLAGLRKASDMLYNATDGQMAFGWITVYDNRDHWADADLQIRAHNDTWPHAFIGGINADTSQEISYKGITPEAGHMIFGRYFNGRSSNSGAWDEENAYETIVHEFAHYALFLFDEYLYFEVIGNRHTAKKSRCSYDRQHPASLMYFQYTKPEFCSRPQHYPEYHGGPPTLQTQKYGSQETSWVTIKGVYSDVLQAISPDSPPWKIISPVDRGAVVSFVNGPTDVPFNFSENDASRNTGAFARKRIEIKTETNRPIWSALVSIVRADGTTLDQGRTNRRGEIDVLGVGDGDIIYASAPDGGLVGSLTVINDSPETVVVGSNIGGSGQYRAGGVITETTPLVRIVPGSTGETIDYFLEATEDLAVSAHLSGADAPSLGETIDIGYSPSETHFHGTVGGFAPEVPLSDLRVTYAITLPNSKFSEIGIGHIRGWTDGPKELDITSTDGNLNVHAAAESFAIPTYVVINHTNGLPGLLPEGRVVVGGPYSIQRSGAQNDAEKSLALTFNYQANGLGEIETNTGTIIPGVSEDSLRIYFWDPNAHTWLPLESALISDTQKIATSANLFGIYALLAEKRPIIDAVVQTENVTIVGDFFDPNSVVQIHNETNSYTLTTTFINEQTLSASLPVDGAEGLYDAIVINPGDLSDTEDDVVTIVAPTPEPEHKIYLPLLQK